MATMYTHRHGALTHFDFDCCGIGYRIFELATFNWSMRLRGQEESTWPEFLAGYESQRQLKGEDFSLLYYFVVIPHIWLMALHMSNAFFRQELSIDVQ